MARHKSKVAVAALLLALATSFAAADAPAEWTPPLQIAVAPIADAADKCSEALLAAFSKELGASGYRFLAAEETALLAKEPTAEKISEPLSGAHPLCEMLVLITAKLGELEKKTVGSHALLPRVRYSITTDVTLVLHDPAANKAFDRISFAREAYRIFPGEVTDEKELELVKLSLAASANLEASRYAVSRVAHLSPVRQVLKVAEVEGSRLTAGQVCGPIPPSGRNFDCYKAQWKQEKEDEPGRWEFEKKGSAVVDTNKGRIIALRILEGEAQAGWLLARPDDKAFR